MAAAKGSRTHEDGFVQFLLEQMAGAESVRARKMFGGYGIFTGDLMFALVWDDRLFLKTDAETLSDFESRGLKPFTYEMSGRIITMSYSEAPEEVFDDPDAMTEWVGKAMAAARRASRKKRPRRKG